MNNEEMLEKIRLDRPNQVIHEVISFKENGYGFYDVKVDMESMFFDTKIKHTKATLPYPFSEYEKLSEKDQFEWRFNENSELNISDVSDSELFELKLTKDEVLKLKRCLSSLYRNYTPDGGSLSFASQLEDKLSEFLK